VKDIVVVGASLAGLSVARALRQQGYDGRLSIVGAEKHRPYDRPPLSKSFLAGSVQAEELLLESDDEDLAADWRLGATAVTLRPSERAVELADGAQLTADAVVLATGATPVRPFAPGLLGVHTLRTLDDAVALRAELVPGGRLVVVGAGFIGAEVAATAAGLGLDVTVVEAAPVPLAGPLGPQMGAAVAALHAAHGVRLVTGVGVTGLSGTGRVAAVELGDGRSLPADVVVLGVGVRPNVGWLAGSGLDVTDGVRCDSVGTTTIGAVFAVGDCATWFDPALGEHHRLEHWTGARERAAIAVAALLSGGTERRAGRPPYFWSDQYGSTIQVAGHTRGSTSVTVEEGSVTGGQFLAVYRTGDEPVAVLSIGHAKLFMRWRKELALRAAQGPSTALAG
jgi:NADPH-dependent 2,4-dienoyl-CoA reductase/sulfur reductase-like enzyme